MDIEDKPGFDELLQEVQQQFICYSKKSSKRFHELEELLEVAAKTTEVLKKKEAQRKKAAKLVYPVAKGTREEPDNKRPAERNTHLSLQKFNLNVPKSEDEFRDDYAICNDFQNDGLRTRNGVQFGALFNEEVWNDMDSEDNITTKREEVVYDAFPGEDKDDWHSDEIICIALGLEDFFQPKKNFEEGNSSGAKDLECTSDFRITPRGIKSNDREDRDVRIKSGSELLLPKDLITFTKLDGLRLQPAPCIILKGQDVNSSEDCDKKTGSSRQHSSREIQVNYKLTSAEANKGMMQLLVGAGQAYEAMKDKRDAIPGAQNRYHSESGTVGKFRREKLEFFYVNHLIKRSHCAHKSKLLLGRDSEKRSVLVEGGHGLKDSINVIKEAGARERETEIYTNKRSLELAEFASIQGLQQRGGNINLNNEMIPIQLEDVSSMIPTIREIFEAFCSRKSVKDFPTDDTYDLGIRSSNFGKDNMLIFDPGGKVQIKKLKGVNHNSYDMIKSEVQLKEAAMKNSFGCKLKHWHDIDFLAIEQQLLKEPSQLQRKVFLIEIEVAARLQGQGQNIQKESDGFDKIVDEINQQFVNFVRIGMISLPYQYQFMVLGQGRPAICKSMRPAHHEASKKSVATYIFDPGGCLSCLNEVNLFVGYSAGRLNRPSARSTMRTWLFSRGEECQDS